MNIKKDRLEETMKNMAQPSVKVDQHQKEFRLTLLNTRKSAMLGLILLLLPFLFLTGVIFKHYLQIDLGLLTAVYDWIGEVDQKYGDNSLINWVIRFLLLVGPLIAILVNLLAVLHVRYEKTQKEIVASVKLNWLNWLIILSCGVIFSIFFLYLIIENA